MNSKNNPDRNRPAEKGTKSDPDLRDRSGIQPGTNTISSSNTDNGNQHVTKTAKEDFRTEEDEDRRADKKFDE